MHIQGKTIVVTGASEGIGRSIALALAKKGAHVALVARSSDKLKQVLAEVRELGATNSKIYVCDVQALPAIHSTAQQIIQDFGSDLIGLVNNAGIWHKLNSLENISDEDITRVVQTNLLGVLRFTKELLPTLKSQSEAAIINISSRSGLLAHAGQTVYAATKWGIRGFTGVLKEDLKDSNVHVAGVYQGKTNTNIFNKAGENYTPEQQSTFIPSDDLGEIVAMMLSLPPLIWLSEIHVESR